MGEPSCYNIHSSLGGYGGVQSDLVVYANPFTGLRRIQTVFLLQSVILILFWVVGLPIKPHGFDANPLSGSPKHPRLQSEKIAFIERHMIPNHIVGRPAYFVTEGFCRYDSVFLSHLSLIKSLSGFAIACSKIRGFHIGPSQILVAVSFVVLSLFLPVGNFFTSNTSAV
jgi:hypothetical protein